MLPYHTTEFCIEFTGVVTNKVIVLCNSQIKKTKRLAVNVHTLIEIIVTVNFSNTIRILSGSLFRVRSDQYVVTTVTRQFVIQMSSQYVNEQFNDCISMRLEVRKVFKTLIVYGHTEIGPL